MGMTARKRRARGLFITLEGPEGSGKSTQIRYLAATLRRSGYHVVQTREPGGTVVAEAIRNTLLLSSSREPITSEAESLLILAARSQHVTHLIAPALQRGAIILCDRFSDSTFAYQGFARGLDLTWLHAANAVATNGLNPDLTVLFDVPVAVGLARRRKARGKQNRLDRESERFHRLVRKGFLTLAARSPRRIKVVDANRSVQEIRAEMVAIVLGWLGKRRRRPGTR
ncbi:MAG TPA: dTMP kinase [Nitrospira sp.]|nr:dTMP kinase [Nitrospira sp.]